MYTLTYYILYIFNYLLSLLPYRVLYFFSDNFLYPVIFYIVRYRRHIVEKNLCLAFPEKTVEERLEIEHKFYHFFCDYFYETMKLLSISKAKLKRHMMMEGLDEIEKSLDKNGLVFVYLGHYCNWEYMASLPWWMNENTHCSQLYSGLRNKVFNHFFLKIRGHFGGMNINKYDSLRTIMHFRRENTRSVIGFISDQGPRWPNIHLFLPFLHQDTPVFTGTERIAHRVKASIYFAHVTRPKRGYYQCKYVRFTDDVNQYPEYEITRLYMRDLEAQIKTDPSLWLWSHDRWKRQRTDTDAPEEWKATIKDGKIVRDSIKPRQ